MTLCYKQLQPVNSFCRSRVVIMTAREMNPTKIYSRSHRMRALTVAPTVLLLEALALVEPAMVFEVAVQFEIVVPFEIEAPFEVVVPLEVVVRFQIVVPFEVVVRFEVVVPFKDMMMRQLTMGGRRRQMQSYQL